MSIFKIPFHIWKADIYDISHGKSLNLNSHTSWPLAISILSDKLHITHLHFVFIEPSVESICYSFAESFCSLHCLKSKLLYKENREYRGNLLFNVYIISTALNILISLSPIQPQLITITIILILVPRPCHLHDTLP